MIQIMHVSKSFNAPKHFSTFKRLLSFFSRSPKKTVLDNVSLHVNKGEIVGLVGGNGAGKTTLLRIIGGIMPRYEGTVNVEGRVTSLISLQVGFNGRLTATENVLLVGAFMGLEKKTIKEKLHDIFSFAELKGYEHTKLFTFSQGMSIRLVVSLALATNPDVFLADEIFAYGDAKFTKKVEKEIKRRVSKGMCMVLTSHQQEIIDRFCDRVYVLENGKTNPA